MNAIEKALKARHYEWFRKGYSFDEDCKANLVHYFCNAHHVKARIRYYPYEIKLYVIENNEFVFVSSEFDNLQEAKDYYHERY